MEVCNICCENFTRVQRKEVQCPVCDYIVCQSCIKKYILDSINEPHCMNPDCSVVWTRQFLIDNFTIAFINGPYTKTRIDILYDHEMSLLPETQQRLDIVNKRIKLEVEIKELKQEAKDIYKIKNNIIQTIKTSKNSKEKKELEKQRKELFENYKTKKNLIDVLRIEQNHINDSTSKPKINNFIKSCPNDDCEGFLDKEFHCSLCDTDVCMKCNIIISDDKHICLEDNIKSYQLLKKDSKPCPKCASMIYKIHGCDHMFCTRCNHSFSWKTGESIKNNTNPHYYEWIRNNGNEMGGNREYVPCNENIEIWNLVSHLNENLPNNRSISKKISNFHEINAHIVFAVFPRFAIKENFDIRVKYLKKHINADEFKSIIGRRNKINKRNQDILSILQTFSMIFNDCLRKILDTKDFRKINEYYNEIVNLSIFMLENLYNINKLWICNFDFNYIKNRFINVLGDKPEFQSLK